MNYRKIKEQESSEYLREVLLQIWDFLRLFCKTCPNTLCFCKYLLEDPCDNKGYKKDRLQRMHLLSVVKSQVGCYRCATLYISVNPRLVLNL